MSLVLPNARRIWATWLSGQDVVFVGSAFAFNRQSLATCAHLFQGPPRRLFSFGWPRVPVVIGSSQPVADGISILISILISGYGSIPLKIPFWGEWTSIYQLFWCEQKGYKVLTHCHLWISPNSICVFHLVATIFRCLKLPLSSRGGIPPRPLILNTSVTWTTCLVPWLMTLMTNINPMIRIYII